MKTKNIFSTLTLPVAMVLGMMTASCGNEDNIINEQPQQPTAAGYEIPATINASCGDDATTSTAYDATEKKIAFSTGDVLFVQGTDGTAGDFAGELTFSSGTTFEGIITTTNAYTGTADALLTAASTVTATLLPADYGTLSNGYLTLSGSGAARTLAVDATKAIAAGADAAAAKKTAVEQLSYYKATTYSNGFSLAPQNAILSYSISGLANSTAYTPSITDATTIISRSVTTDASGNAYFAVAFLADGSTAKTYTLTVPGFADIAVADRTLTAGKVYTKTVDKLYINASSPDGTVGYYKDGTETERLAIVASLTVNSTTYKYAIATANETSGTPTWTVDGVAYYTFADAKSQFANHTDSYSAANVWRLPTQTELEALAGLTNSWQADPAGRTWTIGSASLFLPAAGLCNSGDADDVGDYGYYWSSTPFDELLAYYLDFGSGYCDVYDDSREAGSSVRLFCKLPSE